MEERIKREPEDFLVPENTVKTDKEEPEFIGREIKDTIKGDTNEDESISIDFSKIKSIFKKKNEKKKENRPAPSKHQLPQHENLSVKESVKEEDEVSIDFKKIKDIFKKKGKQKTASQHSELKKNDEEITFDFKRITEYTKKNAKWLVPLVLILIPLTLSTYFRMQPMTLSITEDWAKNQVNSYYKSMIAQQINQQYPNLPPQNREVLVNKEFNNFLEENKDMVKQQTIALSQQFKSKFQDNTGQTYLSDIDSYYWYAEARNYLNYGQLGDSYNEMGERIFSLRNGRYGLSITHIPFHPVFGAWTFKIANFLNKDISLMGVFCWLSAIIIGLSIIPAFFIGRRITGGNIGGFFAAMLIALNSALLGRTTSRTADTDPHNILFPLLILWMFIESFEAKDLKKKIFFGGLGGFLSGVYTITWMGFWYVIDFILAAILIYFVYLVIINAKRLKYNIKQYLKINEIKNTLLTGGTFFFSTALFITLFSGFNKFINLFIAPSDAIRMKQVAISTVWPNVLTTVAEFNVIDLSGIINQMGGKLLFWLALMGLILMLTYQSKRKSVSIGYLIISGVYYLIILGMREKLNDPITFVILISLPVIVGLVKNIYFNETEIDTKYVILLTIWLAATAYGFTKGIRFAILMVPAFAFALGATVGIVYNYMSSWIAKNIHLNNKVSKLVVMLIICLLLVAPFKDAKSLTQNEVPMMNDEWYDTLTKIKDNTTNAIITSWWDFGHWFFAISERKVTFDGANQGKRIYWVGKSLLTPDEKVTVGLLRMLNCGQEKPTQVIEEFFDNDTVKAIEVLNKMMVLNDKKEAIRLLKNEGLNNEQIAEIIKITYCDDLYDQFYIASEDMVGKAGVWGHFGSWDFRRAKMYQKVSKNKPQGKEILMSEFNLSESQADVIYNEIINNPADQWVSTWPGYQGITGCDQKDNGLECTVSMGQSNAKLIVDLNKMDVYIPANDNKKYYPNSFVYATEDGIEEKTYTENLAGISVVLLPESSQIMITHPEQANSMFTKLFFFNGHGLKCFSKFDERQQIIGGKIQVWKVDFECQQENKVYFLPKEETNETTKDEVHAAHILVSTENMTDEEALELIKSIAENATAENFAELAEQYSDCPSSAQGGDLGWFAKGVMVPEFEQAAFSLNVNEISNPVQTQFGYHLIWLKEKR